MAKAIVFEAPREGYGIDQLRNPITVGELIGFLQDFDENDIVVLSHDNRYTFGSVSTDSASLWKESEDGEWEEKEDIYY